LPILIALSIGGKRFKNLERDITGITPKMLSKELRDLEMNELVKRTVYDTVSVTVEYSLTDYGKSLDEVIAALRNWGTNHRKKIFNQTSKTFVYLFVLPFLYSIGEMTIKLF
jgi:DNA-binding HxlR family transcriptional regulator